MWHIKFRVDIVHQGMRGINDLVTENTPFLGPLPGTLLSVTEVHHCMSGETGTQCGGHVLVGPVGHLVQLVPEDFFRKIGTDYIGTGYDQGVESLLFNLLKTVVVAFDVRTCRLFTWQRIERKRVHVKLGNWVAFTN